MRARVPTRFQNGWFTMRMSRTNTWRQLSNRMLYGRCASKFLGNFPLGLVLFFRFHHAAPPPSMVPVPVMATLDKFLA